MVDNVTIMEVLLAKYLSVEFQVMGQNMVGNYEDTILKPANSYAMAIMNLTRSGLDRALIARILWVHCTIQAIYCIVLSKPL